MNINKLDFFIKDKKTDIQKNEITNIIKERLCHHKVRFLCLLINWCSQWNKYELCITIRL